MPSMREEGWLVGDNSTEVEASPPGPREDDMLSKVQRRRVRRALTGVALTAAIGALLLAGAYDFANTRVGVFGPGDDWLGRLEGPGGWFSRPQGRTAGSPVTWLDAKDPETLVIHGGADPILSIDQSRALQHRSAAVGHGSRLQSFGVTTTAFGAGCRGHVPWCGAPVEMVNRFLDGIRGGQQ